MHDANVQIERGPWFNVGPTRRFQVVRATLPLRAGVKVPGGQLRVIHLTDLHLRGRAHPALRLLAERLAADRPDLVLFTGDFADDKFAAARQMPFVAEMGALFQSVARLGCFGVVGNHDGDLVAARLESMGVVPLDGGITSVGGVDLIGLPGTMRSDGRLFDDLDRDPHRPTIVLSHYPDEIRRLDRLSPDLMLAGHTHGGQICLPIGGGLPLLTHDELPWRMARGVHRVDETWLVVSRGVGTTKLPIRVFCPAEAVELTLVAREASGGPSDGPSNGG